MQYKYPNPQCNLWGSSLRIWLYLEEGNVLRYIQCMISCQLTLVRTHYSKGDTDCSY